MDLYSKDVPYYPKTNDPPPERGEPASTLSPPPTPPNQKWGRQAQIKEIE